jgi:hypothetical protein
MRPGKAQRRRVLTEKHSEELQRSQGASGCLAGGAMVFHKLSER